MLAAVLGSNSKARRCTNKKTGNTAGSSTDKVRMLTKLIISIKILTLRYGVTIKCSYMSDSL